jgi:hypothetical protein
LKYKQKLFIRLEKENKELKKKLKEQIKEDQNELDHVAEDLDKTRRERDQLNLKNAVKIHLRRIFIANPK